MIQTKNMSVIILFTTSNYCEFKIVHNEEERSCSLNGVIYNHLPTKTGKNHKKTSVWIVSLWPKHLPHMTDQVGTTAHFRLTCCGCEHSCEWYFTLSQEQSLLSIKTFPLT